MSASIRLLTMLFILVLVTSACASISAPAPTPTPEPPPDKFLFVGNSVTFWNNGLGYQMEQLTSSANPRLVIEADMVALPGATLETLWAASYAPKWIGKGDFDVVVLQEDIPEADPATGVAKFHEYTRKFDAEIKKSGARPVLFMAWSYPSSERLNWITMQEIAQAHRDIARELGIDVAPVGLAFQRAMKERPKLDMYYTDREHPSIYGTYLAVNVVYATVFRQSPVGLGYLPSGGSSVTKEEAAFLQRIAWETIQEYQRQQ
jgi:hypothetical protein